MKTPFILLVISLALFACKSNPIVSAPVSPVVTITPSTFHGTEFVIDTFKAKIANHDFAQTYFIWDLGDTSIIAIPPQPSFQAIHAFVKPGIYNIRVKAYDIYSNEIIAKDSITATIDTATSSVEILPQFYHGGLAINSFGILAGFSLSVKTSLPANDLYQFWDYGDGTTDSFVSGPISHIFPKAGSYLLKVDVYQKSGVYVGTDTAAITITFPAVSLDSIKQMQHVEAYLFIDSTYSIFDEANSFLPLAIGEPFTDQNITSSWNGNNFSIEFFVDLSQDYRISGSLSSDCKTLNNVTIFAKDTGFGSINFAYGYTATNAKIIAVTPTNVVYKIPAEMLKNNLQNINFVYNQGRGPLPIGSVDSWNNFMVQNNATDLPTNPQFIFVFSKQ